MFYRKDNNQQLAYPSSGGVNVNEANATSLSDVPSKPATVTSALDGNLGVGLATAGNAAEPEVRQSEGGVGFGDCKGSRSVGGLNCGACVTRALGEECGVRPRRVRASC